MESKVPETLPSAVDERSIYGRSGRQLLASAAFDAIARIDKLPSDLSAKARRFVIEANVDKVDARYRDAAVIVGYLIERGRVS